MSGAGPAGPRGWLRIAGGVAGLALVAGALVAVTRQREVIDGALAAIADADPRLVAGLAACVIVNILLTSAIFSTLIARFGVVGRGEMLALIGATTLVNYLPLRPGLLGRVAWHRSVNGIPVAHSTRTIIEAMAASVVVAGLLAAALVATGPTGLSVPVAAALPAFILATPMARRSWRPLAIAGLLRYVDIIAWAGRYWCAFALVGMPVGLDAAIGLACVGVLATLIPFVSNGLGVREWAVGLLAPVLAGVDWEYGVAADLVNRAVEVVVIVPIGLVCVARLWRRARPAPGA